MFDWWSYPVYTLVWFSAMKSVNSISETTGNDSFQRKLLMLKFHVEVEDSTFESCFGKGHLSITYTYKYCINVRPLFLIVSYTCSAGFVWKKVGTFNSVMFMFRPLNSLGKRCIQSLRSAVTVKECYKRYYPCVVTRV